MNFAFGFYANTQLICLYYPPLRTHLPTVIPGFCADVQSFNNEMLLVGGGVVRIYLHFGVYYYFLLSLTVYALGDIFTSDPASAHPPTPPR